MMIRYAAPLILLLSSTAYAKRGDQRDGFNFGVQFRLMSDERSSDDPNGGKTTDTITSLAANPFIGYAIGGILGLGLSFTGETTTVDETKTSLDGSGTTNTLTKQTLRGVSPFVKLLFAKVMYLETGVGVYTGTTTKTSSTLAGSSSFSGNSQSTTTSGSGYGYHFGGGLEVPMGAGFFFNSAFYYRQINLTDYVDRSTSIGMGGSKTEVQFGITEYLQP